MISAWLGRDRRDRVDDGPSRFWSAAATRWVVLVAALGAAGLLVGCSSNADPAEETTSVRHAETLIASFAQTHDDALGNAGSGVGARAGCADRIIGEANEGQAREAYLELMCTSLDPPSRCASQEQTAFLSPAVATFGRDGTVTRLAIDEKDDAANWHWVQHRFPAKWQHVEQDGTRYGALLQSRLQAAHPCH